MIIFYFIHVVGRDNGNSGIPRVSRNLARHLQQIPGIELIPVQWDHDRAALAHADQSLLDTMKLYNGPDFDKIGEPGEIVIDANQRDGAASWLLIPEAPHLGGQDGALGPVHLPYIVGFARSHGIKLAAIFHDAMPITHFFPKNPFDSFTQSFIIYTLGLSNFDLVLPVSQSSADELTGLMGQYGITWHPQHIMKALLLPEEMVGVTSLSGLKHKRGAERAKKEFCIWGTIFAHKNQIKIMEAFNLVLKNLPELDIVLNHYGSIDPSLVEAVRRQVRKSKGRIILHGFVDDRKLISSIKSCYATLFVSKAEGCGLPLAESLWLGKPCITSNCPPMTEIAREGGAVLVDPNNVSSIAGAIMRLATDDSFYDNICDELKKRPMRTWRSYAEGVIAALSDFDEIPSREKIQFTKKMSAKERLRVESFRFGISDMHLGDGPKRDGLCELVDGSLHYGRKERFKIEETTLCFGPYYDLGGGEYSIMIDGQVDGICRVRVTSESGAICHYDQFFNDFDTEIIVSAPKGMRKFEIVLIVGRDTEAIKIDGFSMIRWHEI